MTDQTTSSGPARVLVVEDQGLIALRLEHMLTRLGYQVTEAVSNGEAALQSLERFPPDLVLMDINLEDEMDGVETAARIRARRDVPVVYLTAYSEQMVMDEVKHTHPYGFLAKPVRDQELGATIEMALYKHHMEVQLRESEAKYRLLAENAEDVIWQLNETLDRYTYVSPSVTRLLGYTPQEMMSMPLGAHLAPDSRSQIRAVTSRLLAAEKEGRGTDETQVEQVQYIRKDGTKVWVESRTRPVRDQAGVFRGLIGVTRDIGDRVQSEKKLRESEQRVRRKLDTILLPGGDLGALELADILDVDAFQAMMDHFYDLTGIGMAVVDLAGEVLVATGWQEICTQFHRVHPETRQHCIESDTLLSSGVEPGQLKLYKCKNNMWDMATPIVIGDQHVGNIFLGQFFFEGEEIDRELFREQAERYEFDPEQYLAALDRAPRWSRETVETVFAFYARLATMVSNLSHSNLRLARALSEQDRLLAARRQSEQKFRTLVENVVDWVWQVDTNGVYIYVSPQATQILGYPVSAILGKTPFDFMTSQEVKRVGAIFSELVAKQERILGLEDTMIAQDGHPVFFETNATPLFDAQGTFIGYMGTCRDITARKESEEALRESEAKYRRLVEGSPNILYIYSNQRGALYWSQRVQEVLGYTPADLIKDPHIWHDAIHPDDVAAVDQVVTGHGPQAEFDIEYRIRDADGAWHWLRDRSISKHLEGDEIVVEGLATDITERKQTGEALRRSEQKYRSLFSEMHHGCALHEIICDEEGQAIDYVTLEVNEAFEALLNVDRQDVVGKRAGEMMPEQELAKWVGIFGPVALTGQSTHYEMYSELNHKHFEGTAYCPERQKFAVVFTDVTARKEAREALQQTSERLRILHEIDTAILRAHSPDEIALAALAHLRDLLSCRHISLSEIDLARQQSRETIVLVDDQLRARAADWRPISRIGPRLIETLSRGDIYLVGDLGAQETLSALEQGLLAAGLCSYVSVPMLVQNELVGAINMASPRPDFFQPAHVEILNEIAASLAVAMQQANLLAQTQEDAESKTLLLQEVNHRVMNNLHMIQSILELEMEQSPPRTDRDLDTVLRDIRSRVQGIATVHRMLSSAQRDALDLAQLTSAIVDAASSGAPIPYQVAVAIDAPPDVPHVSAKQAVTLALVLNELTTNSVKYAFADRMGGEIRVCIERTAAEIGAGVRLVFQDDGPGWPDDVLAGERHSMGLWLIQASVTHNLGGEIAWYNEDGAVVEIRFPIRG